MTAITRLAAAPTTDDELLAFIHTACRDLCADIRSAKFYPEADHATRGAELCATYFEAITSHW